MNIPNELQVEIAKLAEYIKKSVEVQEKIDSLIENMDISYEDKVAMHSGITEYVDYGQFCIEDGIGIEEMKVEILVDFRKATPFKKVLCPVCKKTILPPFKDEGKISNQHSLN